MLSYISFQGYRLVEMYECEWMDLIQTDASIRTFVNDQQMPMQQRGSMTHDQVLRGVRDGCLYGMVECDIHVPDDLVERFSEMPPVFKNIDVGKDDIGQHMKSYAEESHALNVPRRTLIGSMKGKQLLIATPLLRWYLDHGLQVTKIYEVVQYTPRSCFTKFGKNVVDARRQGDKDPNHAVIAETMKLIGNSAYDKTITNKEKFREVTTCSEQEAPVLINSSHFRQLDAIGDDLYEMLSAKKTIKMDLPIQIGFFVYAYAKLRMLEFYYDCIDRYLDRSTFQYCCMDTDSAYIALSGPLSTLIKSDMRQEFKERQHQWFPRKDTEEYRMHDKREPGLFKEEWQGEGIIALCSKTYYCYGPDGDKFSCKGLNKRQKIPLSAQRYLDVLHDQVAGAGINRGFRLKGTEMVTYTQKKEALSYLYVKRIVTDDGVSTTPLAI